ncbi:MAG: c-type cytochrome [Bacteroidia bacterium]|nr:c-type cytochrome [Bacteroidia bacterium]
MKNLILTVPVLLLVILLSGCGSPSKDEKNSAAPPAEEVTQNVNSAPKDDAQRGIGKFDASNVKISDKLDVAMAESGEKVTGVKCSSCHKLTEERLVGPGWKGVTQRRKPEWIMNFITNVDEMLNKDPEAQAQLEICLVRMPNQSLSDTDARNILEFMRKNDGVK